MPHERSPCRLSLVLFQPDIPQNAGAMLRLAAALGVGAEFILPCGFLLDDRKLRRAGMDYLDLIEPVRHPSWEAFEADRRAKGRRLVLLTTQGDHIYSDFRFQAGDALMVGQESAGVPESVRQAADARLVIPMVPGARSLNVAQAAAIALAEALRQLGSDSIAVGAGRHLDNPLSGP